MTRDKIKILIARVIGGNTSWNYQENLENIYNNEYRLIHKCPTRMFFEGLIGHHPEITLELIKEVVVEALELSGVELTFVDEEWDNLQLTYYEPVEGWDGKFHQREPTLQTTKHYLGEFFEP